MSRLEMDDDISIPTPTIGGAEGAGRVDEHAPHTYLYLPDLSSQTRWSAHQVPERTEKGETARRPMGFRR